MENLDQQVALTSRQASTYIGMSESWLRQARMLAVSNQQGPPFIKLGRSVRYLKTDLDDWMQSLRQRVE